MRTNKKLFSAVLIAFIFVNLFEFLRNEILFKHLWINHYEQLGLTFPSAPINNIIWMLWSLVFVLCIYVLSKKFSLIQTTLITWVFAFVLMWLVIGNLGVLPIDLLFFALPFSLIETFITSYIIKKFL